MKFSELPKDVQVYLTAERLKMKNRNCSTAYDIVLYNAEGTRYFRAHRCSIPWWDNKGNSMPFGGGTYWDIYYGCVQFRRERNPLGEYDYRLVEGKQYSRSMNGTPIPQKLSTKKEVMELVQKIGIFN